jgi:hypothetical protein
MSYNKPKEYYYKIMFDNFIRVTHQCCLWNGRETETGVNEDPERDQWFEKNKHLILKSPKQMVDELMSEGESEDIIIKPIDGWIRECLSEIDNWAKFTSDYESEDNVLME